MSVLKRLFNMAKSRLRSEELFDTSGGDSYKNRTKTQYHQYNQEPLPADQDSILAEYYSNLELPYGAGLTEVNMAWKKLLKKYHPDIHSNDPEKQKIAHRLVQGLNKAHDELEIYLKNKQG